MLSLKTGSTILLVCHGNINRSAAARIILESQLTQFGILVDSCGFVGPNRPMARKMRLALQLRGYSGTWTDSHRSKLINKSLIQKSQLAFYMDGGNMSRLLKAAPEYRKKYICLAEFLTPPEKRIPDPGFMRADSPEFEQVVDKIVAACNGLATKIQQAL